MYALTLASWEPALFWILMQLPTSGHFLKAGVIDRPADLVSIKFPSAPVVKVVLQENDHKAARFLHSPLKHKSFRERRISGFKLEWNMPQHTPKG